MNSPEIYKQLLNSNKLTQKIIGEVLHSLDTRSKDYQDEKYQYCEVKKDDNCKNHGDEQENFDTYYLKKEDILGLFKPQRVHWVKVKKEGTRRIFDFEEEYSNPKIKEMAIWESSFYDCERYEETHFFDITDFVEEEIVYYQYYRIGDYSFHTLIDQVEVEKLGLDVVQIDENFLLINASDNVLLNSSFCDKVYQLLMSGNYEIV